jgi:hypothetical protein
MFPIYLSLPQGKPWKGWWETWRERGKNIHLKKNTCFWHTVSLKRIDRIGISAQNNRHHGVSETTFSFSSSVDWFKGRMLRNKCGVPANVPPQPILFLLRCDGEINTSNNELPFATVQHWFLPGLNPIVLFVTGLSETRVRTGSNSASEIVSIPSCEKEQQSSEIEKREI